MSTPFLRPLDVAQRLAAEPKQLGAILGHSQVILPRASPN